MADEKDKPKFPVFNTATALLGPAELTHAQRVEKIKSIIKPQDPEKYQEFLTTEIRKHIDLLTSPDVVIDDAIVKAVKGNILMFSRKKNVDTIQAGMIGQAGMKDLQHIKTGLKRGFSGVPKAKLSAFFDTLYKLDFTNIIATQIQDKDSLLPIETQRAFKEWVIEKLPALKAAEKKDGPAPIEDRDAIRVVEVDNLLPEGEGQETDIVATRSAREDNDDDARTQPRMDWITKSMKERGYRKDEMTLIKEKSVENHDPKKNPYKVLNIKNENTHVQIAVCEVIGNATFIIRTPIDFERGEDKAISELKKDPSVFQVNCYTPTQWLRGINHYAFTPIDELKVQLKTRIGWHDKKDALLDSAREFYAETGQTPMRGDDSIIEQGPLAGRTTWQRVFFALQSQAIKGLEHVRNLNDLRPLVIGNVTPQLPFDAKTIFANAVHHIQETNALPADPQIETAFHQNKVTNLESYVSADDLKTVSSMNDFLLAAGLAEKKGEEIIPAPSRVIAQYARFLRQPS